MIDCDDWGVSGSVPTYEQLAALVVEQAGQIERLTARVAELERRLGLNSRNSSKPPSSDGLGKPVPRSLRGRSGRRAGGQPGSAGTTLRQVANPDEVVEHRPRRCGGCRASLVGASVTSVAARQVFDVPPLRVRVTEHRMVTCRCAGCGRSTMAVAPVGVGAPVQYGPGVAAIVVYLAVRQHIPVARLAELCAEVLGVEVSTGWVAAQVRPAALALTGFTDRVTTAIGAAPVAHFDESGTRVGGRLRWVHSASTPTLTHYHLDDKRGRVAMDAAGVLPAFTGVAVHDCWAAYFGYVHLDHAVCNAHILRELTGWHEGDPDRQAWAKDMIDLLVAANRAVIRARADGRAGLDPATLAGFDTRWTELINTAYEVNPRPEAGRGVRIVALIDRLRTATAEIWRFTRNFAVPFDNNQAERDIRMVKLQNKISGGWRTFDGARDWLTIRAYISTVAKNGLNIYQALRDALAGNAWLPALEATT